VVDQFCGTGSTGIAANACGCPFLGSDRDGESVAVAAFFRAKAPSLGFAAFGTFLCVCCAIRMTMQPLLYSLRSPPHEEGNP
jgi:predicted RNA methylase